MRLRQLFESAPKRAAFAVGRMNPATIGHELLVKEIIAAQGDSFLFLTDRAPKLPDNPLTAEEKLDWARKSFNGISIGLAKTVLTAADRLYKMGYTHVTFLEGEDKLYNLLLQYNGVEKQMHNYNFSSIDYVRLERDADADDATGMSGTKLRGYVTDNDLEGFKEGVTDLAKPYAEEMFKKLQGILGVDSVEEDVNKNNLDKGSPKTIKVSKMPTPPKMPTGPDGVDDNGAETGTDKNGNRFVSMGSGTFYFNQAGKVIKWNPPQMINGLSQSYDYVKKVIKVKYNMPTGDANIEKTATYGMDGKLISGDSLGISSGGISLKMDKKQTTINYRISDRLTVHATGTKAKEIKPEHKKLLKDAIKSAKRGDIKIPLSVSYQKLKDAGLRVQFRDQGKNIPFKQAIALLQKAGM